MQKAEMKIVRFGDSDVIATSGGPPNGGKFTINIFNGSNANDLSIAYMNKTYDSTTGFDSFAQALAETFGLTELYNEVGASFILDTTGVKGSGVAAQLTAWFSDMIDADSRTNQDQIDSDDANVVFFTGTFVNSGKAEDYIFVKSN